MSLSLGKALAFFTTPAQVNNLITAALATRGITIDAANYTALVTNYPPANYNGAFAWVEASQGTAWLPGTVGGTYYPLGLYHSNGTAWIFTPSPSQATQAEVDAGTNNDKFVTPLTFTNASKWSTKQAAITATDSNTGTWYPTMVSGAGAIGSSVHINTSGFKVIGSSLVMTGDIQANTAIFTGTMEATYVQADATSTLAVATATSLESPIITSTNGGDGSTSAVTFAGNNGYGGTNYYGAITLNNTSAGATNGKKFIRINATGTLEIVNNAYTTTLFSLSNAGALNISDTVAAPFVNCNTYFNGTNGQFSSGLTAGTFSSTGSISGLNATSFIAGPNAASNVALQVPNEAAIRHIGNVANNSIYFDVNTGGSNNGQFQFRGTSSYTNYAIINSSGILSKTPYIAKTSYNVALDTEIVVGNFTFRISNQGGIFLQVKSTSGSGVNTSFTSYGMCSGQAIGQTSNTGTNLTTYQTVWASHGMDSAGDMVISHVVDKANGRIYRVTGMRNDNGSTTGYNIIAEQLI